MRKPSYNEIPSGHKLGVSSFDLSARSTVSFMAASIDTYLLTATDEDGFNFASTNSKSIPAGEMLAVGVQCAIGEFREAYFASLHCAVLSEELEVFPFFGTKSTAGSGAVSVHGLLGARAVGGNSFSGALRSVPASSVFMASNPDSLLCIGMAIINRTSGALSLSGVRCSIDVTRFDGVKDVKVAY